MEGQHTTPLEKTELKYFGVRLGKIFSNLSIVFLILCLCGILSFVSLAVILTLGFALIILTIGTIFVMVPNYWDILMSASQFTAKLASFFLDKFFIFVAFAILFAILSLILLKLDKQQKHTGRIVVSLIIIGIAIISIIVIAAGVIKWRI